jgi:hypothetical protein
MEGKRLIFLSDTHNQHENVKIPVGDIIIHLETLINIEMIVLPSHKIT